MQLWKASEIIENKIPLLIPYILNIEDITYPIEKPLYNIPILINHSPKTIKANTVKIKTYPNSFFIE